MGRTGGSLELTASASSADGVQAALTARHQLVNGWGKLSAFASAYAAPGARYGGMAGLRLDW